MDVLHYEMPFFIYKFKCVHSIFISKSLTHRMKNIIKSIDILKILLRFQSSDEKDSLFVRSNVPVRISYHVFFLNRAIDLYMSSDIVLNA